jgi:diguanylate cyclase (GGDEF)-like protein
MNSSSEQPPVQDTGRKGLSLRVKLLLPFLIILILLSIVAAIGSLQLLSSSMTQNADERLSAAREVLYREFKKQETVLKTYTAFLQQFQGLIDRFPEVEEVGILQDRLLNTLEDEDISVTFYPLNASEHLPIPSLKALFEQTIRSGQPRFRYSNEFGGIPALMVAAPITIAGQLERIMVLQTRMGQDFLQDITDPLRIIASLHNLEGEMLASSDSQVTPMQLTDDQLISLGSGEQLFLEHGDDDHRFRHLYTAIPLGSSDLVFLSLETSVSSAADIQQTMIFRFTLAVFAAITLGLIVYFRIISRITMPARNLEVAAEALSRGNLAYRVVNYPEDELGRVAKRFNHMAERLEVISEEKEAVAAEKAIVQEKIKADIVAERHKREIAKAHDELRTNQKETAALLQLNQAMISAVDLNVLFDRILQVMHETLECDHIVLLNYNPGDCLLEVTRVAGIDEEALRNVKFNFDQGITGQAAQSRRLIYVKDLDKDDRNLSYHGQVATRGSMISTPLIVKDRLVGVLNLHKKEVEAFSVSELKLIQAVGNQTAIAIDNAQLIEKSRELSNIDELTGLANRRHFQEILKREVAQSRRFNSVFSIIMCDIDHFKKYNEEHGRMRGDALLRQVAQVFLKTTRGIDLVCRFGSEEFVILLPKTNKDGGVSAAEKLRRCINEEDFFGNTPDSTLNNLTMSFGVTEFPGDSKNIYELLNLADRALYAAKNEGRNRTVAWEGVAPGPE